MEKIQERSLKWLWLPQVLILPVAGVGVLLALIPVVGIVLGGVCGVGVLGLIAAALIYRFYFYYQLSLDINAVCEGDGVETKSYLFVYALNIVTFGIYGKYWIYKMAQRLQANAPRYGFKMIIGGKEMLVLDMFSMGWISAWEFVRNMNRIATVYNANGLTDVDGGVE